MGSTLVGGKRVEEKEGVMEVREVYIKRVLK